MLGDTVMNKKKEYDSNFIVVYGCGTIMEGKKVISVIILHNRNSCRRIFYYAYMY